MRSEDIDITKLPGYDYGKDAGIAEERARRDNMTRNRQRQYDPRNNFAIQDVREELLVLADWLECSGDMPRAVVLRAMAEFPAKSVLTANILGAVASYLDHLNNAPSPRFPVGFVPETGEMIYRQDDGVLSTDRPPMTPAEREALYLSVLPTGK